MVSETYDEKLERFMRISREVHRLCQLKRTDHRSRHIGSLNFILSGLQLELEEERDHLPAAMRSI